MVHMIPPLSENAVATIESLRFDPQAQMRWCLIPLASIYWSDELPQRMFLAFSEGGDRAFAMRLFAIRINYWDAGDMSNEDLAFWEAAQARFPDWPIFQRLQLTAEDKRVHNQVQKEAAEFFVQLSEEARELELSNDGYYQSFSATFRSDGE